MSSMLAWRFSRRLRSKALRGLVLVAGIFAFLVFSADGMK
jgi:hypothetical protein